jgi:ribonuclease R
MADDYYRFLEQQHILKGENTKKVYRLGDKVRVQVVRVDMERRQIDLGMADILERVRTDERARGPHRSGVRTKKSSSVRSGEQRKAQRPGRRERQARKGRGPGRGGRR